MGLVHNIVNVPQHFVTLNCIGTEDSIWNCSNHKTGSCNTYFDVSVACHGKKMQNYHCTYKFLDEHAEYSNCTDGDLRLSNGADTMTGRVEICHGHVWFGICADNSNSYNNPGMICKTLGYANGELNS